jgi:hypothetical protein
MNDITQRLKSEARRCFTGDCGVCASCNAVKEITTLRKHIVEAIELLIEARQWKRKGYPVMRDRVDHFIKKVPYPPCDRSLRKQCLPQGEQHE